jgi:SNF2 family DNA or RNA helicase
VRNRQWVAADVSRGEVASSDLHVLTGRAPHLVTLATAVQAPFRSGIRIEDYQLDPVVRALSMPRTNLLIADDVGLGKTIEAGLVMQELMLRHYPESSRSRV